MRVDYRETALVQLRAFPKSVQVRIAKKILFFATQPDPLSFAKPLVGYDAHRFRVGDVRVIADVDGDTLVVLLIVKREGAYRNL